jgi:hypothetical protein
VRATIAAQYPGDRADVDFARCVSALLPGAKTLPSSKKVHFAPNILTMTPDSGYKLTSHRVKGLHPKGRIYVTDVTITDGGAGGPRSASATRSSLMARPISSRPAKKGGITQGTDGSRLALHMLEGTAIAGTGACGLPR